MWIHIHYLEFLWFHLNYIAFLIIITQIRKRKGEEYVVAATARAIDASRTLANKEIVDKTSEQATFKVWIEEGWTHPDKNQKLVLFTHNSHETFHLIMN